MPAAFGPVCEASPVAAGGVELVLPPIEELPSIDELPPMDEPSVGGVVVDDEPDDASGMLAGGVTVTLVSVEGAGVVTVASGVGVMVVLSSFLVQAFSDNASKAASRTEYFIVFPLYKVIHVNASDRHNPGSWARSTSAYGRCPKL